MLDDLIYKIKVNVIKQLAQPGKSLDIGCGSKKYTKNLPNPIGIDINKEFEGEISCPDYWMDARKLEFANETFDNVALLDTLEHIPEADLVIKESWRVLKLNGIMIIVDPNDTVLFWVRLLCGRLRDAFRGNPDHFHRFNKDRFVDLTNPLFKLERRIRRGIFTGYRFRKLETRSI